MLPRILLSTVACMYTNATNKTISIYNAKYRTVYSGLPLHIIFAVARQMSSKVEVLGSYSLICSLKFYEI